MNISTLPSLCCQALWQNAHINRFNQILPKSLSALPTLTHRLNGIAANLTPQNIKQQNNGLKANTRLVKTGRVVQLDNDNNIQTHQRFDALCG